jgi:hypothetical protein
MDGEHALVYTTEGLRSGSPCLLGILRAASMMSG